MIKKKHKCTNSLITDVLKLLTALKVSNVPSSWFKLKELIKRTEEMPQDKQQIIDSTLYFCSKCEEESADPCKCTNENCSLYSNTLSPPHTFMMMNIKQQIGQVLKSTDQNDLLLSAQKSKDIVTSMTDIHHGRIYKNVIHSLRNESNKLFVSLTCNIDGVAVYTSSEQTMWTFTACLNELNRSIRFNMEKIISIDLVKYKYKYICLFFSTWCQCRSKKTVSINNTKDACTDRITFKTITKTNVISNI